MTVEESAALDRERSVDDIALDARRGRKLDLSGADAAGDLAANDDSLGINFAGNNSVFADNQRTGANIAVDGTVELDFTV